MSGDWSTGHTRGMDQSQEGFQNWNFENRSTSQNNVSGESMCYLQLRITPVHCTKVSFAWEYIEGEEVSNKYFIRNLLDYVKMNPSHILIADEATNKFGEPCEQHYHVNIHGKKSIEKAALQKWLNRHGAKGNKAYCVQIREDVDDEGRWWRYCCKENLAYAYGFSGEEVNRMVEMATSERAHQVATNIKTRDRLVNKNQFRDKLFKHLIDDHGECRHKRLLIKHVGKYYQDQGKSPPFNKLADIVMDYLICIKAITWEEWIDERYS